MGKRILFGQKSLIAILIAGFLIFSMWPTIYEWQARGRVHPERHFELVHNFYTDYNFYLSRIRQGKEGKWLATEKYTAEPHDPSLSQFLYVLIGRVANWSHTQTPYVWLAYHTMRVVFGGLLLLVIWKIVDWVFFTHPRGETPPTSGVDWWKIITFLLVVTASTWPKFETVGGYPRFGGYMPWWSVIDSLQRTTFLPHVLLSQAILVFVLWVFAHARAGQGGGFITRHHPGNWLFLGGVGIIVGVIFPPVLVFIYAVLGVLTLWDMVSLTRSHLVRLTSLEQWWRERGFGRVVFGIMTAPTILYYSLLFTQYPWKRLVEFDVLHPTKFSFIEYFLAVGPVLPFGLAGGVMALFERSTDLKQKLQIVIAWVVAWLGLLFIFSKIPQQSPTRFTEMVPHVPLGILTGYLFFKIARWMNTGSAEVARSIFRVLRSFSLAEPRDQAPSAQGSKLPKLPALFSFGIWHLAFVIPMAIIIFAIGSMFSSWLWQRDFVDHKLRATYPIVPHGAEVMYPMESVITAMESWLQVYTPRSSVVLSGVTMGNYIPVYAGNTVFIGHANTVNSETKERAMENFYHNQLGAMAEMAFIRSQGIHYVFYGPEERDIAGGLPDLRTYYPELVQEYDQQGVKIYRVP